MNKLNDIKECRVKKIIFRGDSIFTFTMSSTENFLFELNILGVEYLEMGDIINGVVNDLSIQRLGFKHMKIVEKRNLEMSKYKTIWISLLKEDKKSEIFGLIREYKIEEHSQKYNPISEDKYV
jgi:hypothetical protein